MGKKKEEAEARTDERYTVQVNKLYSALKVVDEVQVELKRLGLSNRGMSLSRATQLGKLEVARELLENFVHYLEQEQEADAKTTDWGSSIGTASET